MRPIFVSVLAFFAPIAPAIDYEVSACAFRAPYLVITHHMNLQGTFDRNWWLVAAAPVLEVGSAESDALGFKPWWNPCQL